MACNCATASAGGPAALLVEALSLCRPNLSSLSNGNTDMAVPTMFARPLQWLPAALLQLLVQMQELVVSLHPLVDQHRLGLFLLIFLASDRY